MPVRFRKVLQWRAIEEKRLQHTLVDDRHALRFHTLVVVEVVPHQLDVADFLYRRIELYAQEIGQDRLADAACERLPVVGIALAVAFDAMAENLVEKHACCTAR
jgi:hypothetical protein